MSSKLILCLFGTLALVYCQETGFPHLPGFPSFPGLPSFPGFTGIPGFSLPDFSGVRQSRSPQSEDAATESSMENHPHHDKFFFSFKPTMTSCNYTTEGSSSCRSCRQALTCCPNNSGIIRNCHGFFPYCNNGRCSIFAGEACAPTTTVTTTTVAGG